MNPLNWFRARPEPVAQPRNAAGQFTSPDRKRIREVAQKLRVQAGLPISEALL
jgi:hypothetical protein